MSASESLAFHPPTGADNEAVLATLFCAAMLTAKT
jgi:hypothetical protein